MYNLENKTILIFGGTGELFGNIALNLCQNQAKVIIIGRNKDKSEIILKKSKYQIDYYSFDILKDDIDKLFAHLFIKYSKLDMIINGAGINSSTSFLDIKNQEIENIFYINFQFVVKCCQIYIKKCIELNQPGKIINIGSVSGLNPLSKVFMYSASKAALHNFSKNLAREYGNRNILTNILVPGFFPAEQNRNILTPERKNNILSQTPQQRFGDPKDLFGMVNLLASDYSLFINGSELVVDGGYHITKI